MAVKSGVKTKTMCSFTDCKSFKKKLCALFIRNSLRKENIPIFNEFYTLFNPNHVYNTRGSTSQMLIVPQINLYQRNLKTDLITCEKLVF